MVVIKFLVFVSEVVSIFSKILTWIIGGQKDTFVPPTQLLGDACPGCPLSLRLCRDPPKVRHTSRTPSIFSRPSTKIPVKSPLYKFYLNCSRRFLSGGFVRVGFCPFPLLSQYICYYRKLNITLNVMFQMYDKLFYKRDVQRRKSV